MRWVFPIESRDKCPSSSLQHGEARERNAVAVAHREGPPGHRCHGAARTSPTFATVAIQQSAGAAGAFECAAPADCQCLLSRAHVSREDSAASPPQQRLPRMAAASNAAASRRIQPPPPAAASTAATALCCPGAAAATSVTATSHECHRRQRRHGHCRRQGGERGAPYVCMRCVSGGCRFLYRKRRYFE